MTAALLLCVLAPVATAAAALAGRPGTIVLAPLPALGCAAFLADGSVTLEWFLLGSDLGLDATGRSFLALAAVLWTAGAIAARASVRDRPRAFAVFFSLSMAGGIGLPLAQDLVTFYVFFALMTLSAWGLVVHDGSSRARHAGRVYIVAAILGEAALLSALVLIARDAPDVGLAAASEGVADSPYRDLILVLLVVGLGTKAGLAPLHVWLPLAHPVAPPPASAVLSGTMIKAGILGLLRLLPLEGAPGLGEALVVIGLLGAFAAVAVGVCQADPKTVLAYSSVSQVGLMAAGVGSALAGAGTLGVAAVTVAAVNHGLAKGSLFLGAGLLGASRGRGVLLAGLAVASLALAGAPATAGAVTKSALEAAGEAGSGSLAALLPWSGVATTLLLARFWVLAVRMPADRPASPAALWAAWAGLLALTIAAPFLVPELLPVSPVTPWGPVGIGKEAWPVALGLAVAYGALRAVRSAPLLPAGDLVVPVESLVVRAGLASGRLPTPPRPPEVDVDAATRPLILAERALARIPAAAAALVVATVAIAWGFL